MKEEKQVIKKLDEKSLESDFDSEEEYLEALLEHRFE
jgi:hypothetical protein